MVTKCRNSNYIEKETLAIFKCFPTNPHLDVIVTFEDQESLDFFEMFKILQKKFPYLL